MTKIEIVFDFSYKGRIVRTVKYPIVADAPSIIVGGVPLVDGNQIKYEYTLELTEA
jgi:hypothetical protein